MPLPFKRMCGKLTFLQNHDYVSAGGKGGGGGLVSHNHILFEIVCMKMSATFIGGGVQGLGLMQHDGSHAFFLTSGYIS